MITMPMADSHVSRVLQEDNTDLAYECEFKTHRTIPPKRSRLTLCRLLFGSRAQVPGSKPLLIHTISCSLLAFMPGL